MYIKEDCWLKDNCNHIDCKSVMCPRQYLTDKFYDNAFISDKDKIRSSIDPIPDLDGTDFKQFAELRTIADNIVSFVEDGNNLYIYSSCPGTGKTSWALRLVHAYIDNIWYKTSKECPVLFINVPRYLLAIKDNITDRSEYVQHIKDNILTCDIVVWDDIGTKSATSFEHETLLSIIDTRICEGKTNIYTSNLSGDDLSIFVGPRLYSRIYNYSKHIEFTGKDKRPNYEGL